MTTTPTRLLILQRICDVLANPTPTDAADLFGIVKVFRGRAILGDEIKPLPAFAVIESPRGDPQPFYAGDFEEARYDHLTLLIQGRVKDDKNDSVDGLTQSTDTAYWLEAACETRLSRITATDDRADLALYPDDFMLGGLIANFEIGSPIVRPPEIQVSSTAFFFLPVRVGIAKRLDQPYTTV